MRKLAIIGHFGGGNNFFDGQTVKTVTLYEELKKTGLNIETGVFGGDMKVSLINDGPVTIMLEK